jgi:hypothetical protein
MVEFWRAEAVTAAAILAPALKCRWGGVVSGEDLFPSMFGF